MNIPRAFLSVESPFDTEGEEETYLTCSSCNYLLIFPSSHLNSVGTIGQRSYATRDLNKNLPNCPKCGRIDMFYIGVYDFEDEIAERKRQVELLRLKRGKAASRIQYVYRCYIIKMHYLAKKIYKESLKVLYKCASNCIQAIGRRYLARRIYFTEKQLLVIKNAHPLLIEYARTLPHDYIPPPPNETHSSSSSLVSSSLSLFSCYSTHLSSPSSHAPPYIFESSKSGQNRTIYDPSVFWYRHPEELSMIYDNYLIFIKRKFFKPSRHLMETNILKIATRINQRVYFLIMNVQARFRGVYGRIKARRFRIETLLTRMILWHEARCIQAFYRGYKGRLLFHYFFVEVRKEVLKQQYLDKKLLDSTAYNMSFNETQLARSYSSERAYERTARLTGKVASARKFENRKMRAFASSSYSDDSVTVLMNSLLQYEKDKQQNRNLTHKKRLERKAFIYTCTHVAGREHKKQSFTILDNEKIIYNTALVLAQEKQQQRHNKRIHANTTTTTTNNKASTNTDLDFIVTVNNHSINLNHTYSQEKINENRVILFTYYYQQEMDALIQYDITRIWNDQATSKSRLKQQIKAFNSEQSIQRQQSTSEDQQYVIKNSYITNNSSNSRSDDISSDINVDIIDLKTTAIVGSKKKTRLLMDIIAARTVSQRMSNTKTNTTNNNNNNNNGSSSSSSSSSSFAYLLDDDDKDRNIHHKEGLVDNNSNNNDSYRVNVNS